MQSAAATSSRSGRGDGNSPGSTNDDAHGNNSLEDGRRQNQKNQNNWPGATTKFKGKCEELEGAVYNVDTPQSGQDPYNNTTKEIAEYAARVYDEAGKFRLGLINLQLTKLVSLKPPGKDATVADIKIYKMDLKEFCDKSRKRDSNMSKIFALILGQCLQAIQDKIEAAVTWSKINQASNVIGLLKLIRQSMYTKATIQHPTMALLEAETALHKFRQTGTMTNSEYLEKVKGLVEVYKHLGGEPGCSWQQLDEIADATKRT